MVKPEIFGIIFREKPAQMLITMRNSDNEVYASSLAKKVDCTYSHVVKVLQQMQKSGLVTFKKKGRLKILALTKRGEEVADHLDRVKTLL